MPITKLPSQITDADRPFLCSRGHADGTVTLYYAGDTVPLMPIPAGPEQRTVSVQEFRSRFTDAELAGIVSSPEVAVKVLLVKLQTRPDVDLADPQVQAGLNLLVSKSLLTAPRRAVVGA